MDILELLVFIYFLAGSVCYSFYGFLNHRFSTRTVLAFSVSYILLSNIITEQLLNNIVNDEEINVDTTEVRAKVLRLLFGYNPWEIYFNGKVVSK